MPPDDYDDDRGLRGPRRWHRVKTAFGPVGYGFATLAASLEVVARHGLPRRGGEHPRRLLAAAVFDFLSRTAGEQASAVDRWEAWLRRDGQATFVRRVPAAAVEQRP